MGDINFKKVYMRLKMSYSAERNTETDRTVLISITLIMSQNDASQ